MSSSGSDSDSSILAKPSEKAKGKQKASNHPQPAEVTSRRQKKNAEDWPYKPPPGAILLNAAADAGEFDWDSTKDGDDLELWIIRVPDVIKPKALDGLKLDVPSSSKTARIGSTKQKHVAYDVWSLGKEQSDLAGGEEIKNLACLLPRRRKDGKLYAAPNIPTRHLLLSAKPVLPTPDCSAESPDSAQTYMNPVRPSYPKEFLKHRFMPYGSLAQTANGEPDGNGGMDVDDTPQSAELPMPQAPAKSEDAMTPRKKIAKESKDKTKIKEKEGDETKARKRKVDDSDATTPKKKSKKVKSSE